MGGPAGRRIRGFKTKGEEGDEELDEAGNDRRKSCATRELGPGILVRLETGAEPALTFDKAHAEDG